MRNNITPFDISSSREYYGLNSSSDIYKGTSFKFSGEWAPNTHYFNDEYIIDFVSWNGSLWACQRNHLSTEGTVPSSNSRFWTYVLSGIEGKSYIPYVENGILTFKLQDGALPESVNIDSLKGKDGKDGVNGKNGEPGKDGKDGTTYIPDNSINNGYLTFRSATNRADIVRVDVSDLKGDKGDVSTPEFKLVKQENSGSLNLYWRVDNSDWSSLGSVGGKSPKLLRVLSTVENPDNQNESLLDDRILWGYDGEDVQNWATLCHMNEFRSTWVSDKIDPVTGKGNKPVKIVLDEETGEPKVVEDTDKLWFDPFDNAVQVTSSSDFLWEAYQEIGGKIESREEFETAFANLSNTSGFSVRFATSYDTLPAATKDLLGIIYMVPQSGSKGNWYEEYIVIHAPSAPEDEYTWEKFGVEKISADLSDYATKQNLNELKAELEEKIHNASDPFWNEV